MIEIEPTAIADVTVTVPGSKSYTHRMLIAAALSDGQVVVKNPLKSEDTLQTLKCLQAMGAAVQEKNDRFIIAGTGGRFTLPGQPINLSNSGTSMRLLTAVAALGQGSCILTGSKRMQQRPIQDLLDGLNQLGVKARSIRGDGCPPVEITGGRLAGGRVSLDCHISSQFLSAILLIAPLADKPVTISVSAGPVSRPYVDMTLDVMKRFGVVAERSGYEHFIVPGGQTYHAEEVAVEPDCSQAGYFWAAAAITGGRVRVAGIDRNSKQGDVRFSECLAALGCDVKEDSGGIAVSGRPMKGITVDMADMPDVVPTLAVVAAYAQGTSVIQNVGHLRAKESDRLGAVVKELTKMGIEASCTENELIVRGGTPRGAEIETYDDHRIAMSFAVAGLKTPGIRILDETCVKKSFPNFWAVFEGLYDIQ